MPDQAHHSNHSQKQVRQNFNFDLWLVRLSHISQVGLLFLATFGFFYTVLPLYQKAALDEAIAKQEVELRKNQAQLKQAYKQLRWYTVSHLIFGAGAECSGLLIPPEPFRTINDDRPYDALKQSREILKIDISRCLADKILSPLSDTNLNEYDRRRFAGRVVQLGQELEQQRKKVRTEFESFPQRAEADPTLLPPLANGEKLLDSLVPPSADLMHQSNIYAGQNAIVDRYGQTIRDQISHLTSFNWDDEAINGSAAN